MEVAHGSAVEVHRAAPPHVDALVVPHEGGALATDTNGSGKAVETHVWIDQIKGSKRPLLYFISSSTYPNVGCPVNEMTGVGGRQRPVLSDDAGFTIVAAITAKMATAEGRDFVGIVEGGVALAILFKCEQCEVEALEAGRVLWRSNFHNLKTQESNQNEI